MHAKRTPVTTVEKEMGISHAEFYDGLPALLEGVPYSQEQDVVAFRLDGGKVAIRVGEEGTRRLGKSVHLPVTRVALEFSGCGAEEVDGFVRRFTLRYMKGGG